MSDCRAELATVGNRCRRVIREAYPDDANTCIVTTRVLGALLEGRGYSWEPYAANALVMSKSLHKKFLAASERLIDEFLRSEGQRLGRAGGATSAAWYKVIGAIDEAGQNRHVVAFVTGSDGKSWLVDASIDQAHSETVPLQLKTVVAEGRNFVPERFWGWRHKGGIGLAYRIVPADRWYESTPAWTADISDLVERAR